MVNKLLSLAPFKTDSVFCVWRSVILNKIFKSFMAQPLTSGWYFPERHLVSSTSDLLLPHSHLYEHITVHAQTETMFKSNLILIIR